MTTINDTKSLRLALVEVAEAVIKGKYDAVQTKTLCSVAQQIYNTISIEARISSLENKGVKIRPIKF